MTWKFGQTTRLVNGRFAVESAFFDEEYPFKLRVLPVDFFNTYRFGRNYIIPRRRTFVSISLGGVDRRTLKVLTRPPSVWRQGSSARLENQRDRVRKPIW